MPPPKKRSKSQASTSKSQPNKSKGKFFSQRENITSSSEEETEDKSKKFEELINGVVRYIVLNASNNGVIKKADIQKNAMPGAGRQFDSVITQAIRILQKTYGFNLVLDKSGTPPSYIVTSCLPYKKLQVEDEERTKDGNRVLLLLVLSHIFMSHLPPNEESLYGFLHQLNIDTEQHDNVFGNVKEYINITLLKQKYIATDIHSKPGQKLYKWGLRAEKEISKMEVLKFVCEMYNSGAPEHWDEQYKKAKDQENETKN